MKSDRSTDEQSAIDGAHMTAYFGDDYVKDYRENLDEYQKAQGAIEKKKK